MVVLGAIYRAYPDLLSVRGDRERAPKDSYIRHPFQGKSAGQPGGEATSIYRGSIERLGIDEASRIPLVLSERWNRSPLNLGVHDANKGSPAVDETGVYVGADSSWFYAYSLDGELRWRFYFANASHGIHGTPALDEKRVYIGAYNGILYALDKLNGALSWSLKIGDAIGSSPTLHGDDLYISVETTAPQNGFVAKVNKNTGQVIWLSHWLGQQSHASPAIDLKAFRVYVGANNGRVVAINSRTGEFLANFPVNGPVKGTGVIADDTAYFLTRTGWIHAFDIAKDKERFAVALPATSRPRAATLASPTFVPNARLLIVAFGGHTSAIDSQTGAIVWSHEAATDPPEFGTSSALLVRPPNEERYIAWIGCGKRELCAFEPTSGALLNEITLRTKLTGVPVAFRSSLFVALNGAEGGLSRFDGASEEPTHK